MAEYDVIVVGAGSAGSVAAATTAKLGLKTLLIDQKDKQIIGKKVCGDEVSKSHFDESGVKYPEGNEIAGVISGAIIYPPNHQNPLILHGWKEFAGWTLNRHEFGQRLLQEAISAGAELRASTNVLGPIIEDGFVKGVVCRDKNTKEKFEVRGKIVIDASGFASVIRKRVNHPLVEKDVDPRDVAICWRDIIELDKPLEDPETAIVILGGKTAPKGYVWIFPKGPKRVNAGLGVPGGMGYNPRKFWEEFRNTYPMLKGQKVIETGGGSVPVRRPVWSLVADGVMFVGDAALQVNPIHGGGIGAGIRAAIMAGETAKEAIDKGDVSHKGLWSYNLKFMRTMGKRLASLDVFRLLLQDVSDEDLNFGLKKRILEEDDLMAANRGENINMTLINKLKRAIRGMPKVGLLLKIKSASKSMNRITQLYENYPEDPEKLEQWKQKVIKAYKDSGVSRIE